MSRRAAWSASTLAVLVALGLNFDSLLLHLGDHLPGTQDQSALSLLSVWWPVRKLSLPDGLAIHSFVGAPQLSNHLRDLPVLPSVVFSGLRPFVGPVVAFNLLLILSQVGTHLVLLAFLSRERVPTGWAVLASLMFLLSPWYTDALAQADVITAGFWALPLTCLVWQGWLTNPSPWRAVGVALALYCGVLSGIQNSLWIAALWLPYALFTGRKQWAQREYREQLALAGLLLLFLILVFPLPDLVRTLQGNEPAYGPALAAPLNRSFFGWALRSSPAILVAAVATLLRGRLDRRSAFWWAVAGLALAVAVGLLPDPYHMLLGGLDLPYRPLADRDYFVGVALAALLVAVCLTWREEMSRRPSALRWLGLGACVMLVTLATNPAVWQPLPQRGVQVPAFYRAIASEPEDYLVLEYPFGLSSAVDGRSLGDSAFLARYAVWHQKRPVSGVLPYVDPLAFDWDQQNLFLFPGDAQPVEIGAEAVALGVAVREWRIGYIVVHPDLLADDVQRTIQQLVSRSQALCPPVTRDGLVVYRALWHPAGCSAQ